MLGSPSALWEATYPINTSTSPAGGCFPLTLGKLWNFCPICPYCLPVACIMLSHCIQKDHIGKADKNEDVFPRLPFGSVNLFLQRQGEGCVGRRRQTDLSSHAHLGSSRGTEFSREPGKTPHQLSVKLTDFFFINSDQSKPRLIVFYIYVYFHFILLNFRQSLSWASLICRACNPASTVAGRSSRSPPNPLVPADTAPPSPTPQMQVMCFSP